MEMNEFRQGQINQRSNLIHPAKNKEINYETVNELIDEK